ncbi:alkaline phosphatase family protein [Prosthecobacter sp.]|uniref:LTA synthase family protein n=1 Tax=Prosthecobacter sp. TaxID=1965333 RepID=UPI001D8729D0|nr:alkaline phosphatase family protein [Prosthecobacter sp.]MCB1279399.1 sulfatase-like hydrolase/transferase [Prosthecobacter sp.]
MLATLFLILALFTRLALLFQARNDVAWDLSLLGSFGFGLWYDLLAACYALVPWFLLTLLLPVMLWRSKAAPWIVAVLTGLYAVALIFIGVAEWFFWDEFQVRFNFIAVDYLIFTQEVIDNIQQSYPMPLIFTGLGLAGAGVAWGAWRLGAVQWVCAGDAAWTRRLVPVLGITVVVIGISNVFSQSQLPRFNDEFNRELAKDGPYAFCAAFWESEIDYERFYLKQNTDKALARAKELLTLSDTPPASTDPHDLRRFIKHEGPEKRHNIVFVSVESLSAAFMSHFKVNFKMRSYLTPNLDRLADEGILFTNLYATGTRTVRGLEALTLCVPPTPGQSIVWRPKNTNLFTSGSLCRRRGYDVSYVYGGDAMFDNMRNYFSRNNYRVIDRGSKPESEITFQNAWGVADEDLFRWATQEADSSHAANKPFFMHVMTVSNHRPFTFPENRIDMPQGSRDAAVKYTDWCIGDFLEKAKTKPWFANTIFVIVADHCHGSAGRMELDVTKYHIPAIVWNPQLIQPRVYDRLCSQIDIVPTLFGMMNWSYTTRSFGQDVFSPGYTTEEERIYVSNYQKIAYITQGELAILKPKQEFTTGKVDLKAGTITPDKSELSKHQLDDTISLYQSASWLFRNGHLGAETAMP